MTAAITPEPTHVPEQDIRAALKLYGIVQVPAYSYEYGGYRYTNIKDAIAEAKRHPAPKAKS